VHPANLLLELGAVIFTLGVLGRLAGRIGLSPIPLYLLAGLAFGKGGLLPLTTSEGFLSTGADIGVVLLLLLLGLEYSAEELVANLRAHAPDGIVNVVLNATPGVAAALLLGWSPVAALAMGGVTYAASSGIAAKLLADLGRLGNRETPVVLSLLVLEDLSMAFYLPVLTALAAGVGLLQGSIAEVVAIVAIGVALLVALRFGSFINRLVFSTDDEVLLLRVFGLALLVAGIAERLQVSGAVGAFLIGIALSGKVAEGARSLLTPLRDLFAAVFFVFFGLNTDPALIPPVLLPALVLAGVTTATKAGTGWWAARRAGIGRLGRVRAGTVIVARGEFNIVIAGLAAGVEPRLGPLAATYVLIMAVVGPVIARLGEPTARLLTRDPKQPQPHPPPLEAAPPREERPRS
jgi:CPA2 family monovalent cation:H+ antiporter-2